MTTATEVPLLDSIRKCSPGAKKAILAALLREQVAHLADGNPITIEDQTGECLGSFLPAFGTYQGPRTLPPMTPEQRAELQRRVDERDKSFTVDELFASMNLEDPRPIE